MKPALAVAALSVRQLASSAGRGGWQVHALDLFGDLDTRAAASSWHPIGAPQALRIDGARLLEVLRTLRHDGDCVGWVAGAGFESQPGLLAAGAQILPLLGNDAATTARARDPRAFFPALDAAAVAYPQTRFAAPEDRRGWLVKNAAGSGGWRVRRADASRGQAPDPGDYFQREAPGRPMSLLFAAARGRVFPIGINALLVGAVGPLPFVYHGAIGPVCTLDSPLGGRIVQAAQALAGVFALRGLASFDFMLDGETILALELNARPSATMTLYDADFPAGLVQMHVLACAGTLPGSDPRNAPRGLRGELTIYARAAAELGEAEVEALQALGCADLPHAGSRFAPGAPVCSVSAQAGDLGAVLAELARREAAALAVVQNRNEVTAHVR